MARPLRIEFPGATYHVTTRGDRREPIYQTDADRRLHLALMAQALRRFDGQLLAYCLMGNHFHLVLQTRQANLSRLMRHVNGTYTQAYNRRHGLVGHLFQGRFKAILVDRDAYLLALCRYVERNPVAAGWVPAAGDWPWSSYRAHVGLDVAPDWLEVDALLGQFSGRPLDSPRSRQQATQLYANWVGQARLDDASFWQDGLRGQVFLGGEAFAERMQQQRADVQRSLVNAPSAAAASKAQRQRLRLWANCLKTCAGRRDDALLLAYRAGSLNMMALAQVSGLSVAHVSRLIGRGEGAGAHLKVENEEK